MRHKLLKKLSNIITRYPWQILFVAIALTALSGWYSYNNLELHTDQDDLVSESYEFHKRYKDYLREFGDFEYLYIVVELKNNLPEAKDFTRTLAKRLRNIPEIREVLYQISNPVLEKSFLLYLSESELAQLTQFLTSGPTSIDKISQWNSLSDVISSMNEIISSPNLESEQENMRSGFIFLDEMITGLESTLENGRAHQPQLAGAFLGSERTIDEDGFIITPNGKLLFTFIMPEKSYQTLSVIEEPLRKIRAALDDTRAEYPDVTAGLTGRPVLQADEMTVTNNDMIKATILAIIAVTVLFVIYFGRLTRPIMAILSLIFGMTWTLGLSTLIIGYLNLLSSVFAIILIGAGIEFGLQIVSRYREELEKHNDPKLAIEMSLTRTGRGNITAALTTSAAFFIAMFTGFKALGELGFIAGSGVILCLLSLIIVLPAMMYLRDKQKRKESLKTKLLFDFKIVGRLYKKPVIMLVALAALTIAGLPGLAKLRFDNNLLNLQADGLESVEYEKIIIEKSDESTWYAISISDDPAESLRIAGEMGKKNSVGSAETFEMIVPANQDKKIEQIAALKKAFEEASFQKTAPETDILSLKTSLAEMKQGFDKLIEMAFSAGRVDAVEELETLNTKLTKINSLLDDESKKPALNEFQNLFITKFRNGIEMLKNGLDPLKIQLTDLPEGIRKRFVNNKGNYATYTYPKENIWDPEKMKVFIEDIRNIDPEVTGTPVEVFESSILMQKSFRKAALFALIAIFLLVILDFKNIKYALLSVSPLLAGILWLLELMGWLGVPFNLANFFAIPILLGVGVDNGVQIVHRYIESGVQTLKEHDDSTVENVMSHSTGAAVILTSLTTGISFGLLLLSQHRGIQSLGFIMALGAVTCLAGSIVLLPALLKIIRR